MTMQNHTETMSSRVQRWLTAYRERRYDAKQRFLALEERFKTYSVCEIAGEMSVGMFRI